MKAENVVITLVIAGLAVWAGYMIFGPKADKPGRTSEPISTNGSTTNPTTQILTKLVKNESGTLSLIKYNSVTNEIINSRILAFNEAVRLAGSFSNVCQGPPNGKFGASYSECKTIKAR